MAEQPSTGVLFAIDLDGTLLNPDGEVDGRDRSAVATALEAGASVMICTGRGQRMTAPVLDALPAGCYAACHNGALVLSPSGSVLARTYLAPVATATVVAALLAAGLEPLVYVEEAPHDACSRVRLLARASALGVAELSAYLSTKTPILRVVDDPAAAAGGLALGIATFGAAAQIGAAVAPVAAASDAVRCWSAPFRKRGAGTTYVLEVVPREGGKASALRTLSAQLGIPLQSTVAIGDNINDLEMLEAAGTGVAMANAEDAIKAAAAWTTTDNRSAGVAAAIAAVLNPHGAPSGAPAPV